MKLLDPDQYQADAHAAFDAVARELHALLPQARVEHVGASSIPGAISKGDLDICVVVSAASHASVVEMLEAAGYGIKPDTFRTPELCMLVSPRTDLDLALQVVAAGSRFEFFMRFRDALRISPELVEQYNQIKRESMALGHDRYRDEKARFINAVLDQAR
ncbi:GrpB family protein [Roseateles sp. NT4]|uniref:GrpB family protein n=1 Tax=Roseateles sp. NT4 TaxID=3453715 RepID=UPI003EEFD646